MCGGMCGGAHTCLIRERRERRRERTREIKLRSPPPSASMHATPGTSAEIEAVKKFSRSSVSIADICCRSCCFMYLPRRRGGG